VVPIPKSILSRPGALLVIAARTGQERANARLAAMGLTVRMCGVLNLLADEGPLTQHQIGEMLGIDRTTMVELLDDLEQQGILRREVNPEDRRSHLIKLTAPGKARQRVAMKAFDEAAAEFFSPLNSAERQHMAAMLKRLITRPDNP
jgi:MarR family transcriptional regulator, lower aerobic nicotinate degradation pathway regulator